MVPFDLVWRVYVLREFDKLTAFWLCCDVWKTECFATFLLLCRDGHFSVATFV